jgi:hypothetical protein
MLILIFLLFARVVGKVYVSVKSNSQTPTEINFDELEQAFEWITEKNVDEVHLILTSSMSVENVMIIKPWIFLADIFTLEAEEKEGSLDITFQDCAGLFFRGAKKVVFSNLKFSWEKKTLKKCNSSVVNLNNLTYFACKVN